MGHDISDRDVVWHDDGTCALVAFCSCGWSVKVGPYPSAVRAELALESALARHAYPSPEPPDVEPGGLEAP